MEAETMSEQSSGGTERDDGLKNPMRFSVRNRRINIQEKLRHPEFNDKQVTEIEIQDGQLYVHWERSRAPQGERSPLFDEQDRETFRAAVETWGIDAQADMAEEEAAEFIAASKHYARGKVNADELVDELADIRIMQEQLAEFIGRERVEQRIQEKMDRLRERLDQSIAPGTDRSGGGNRQ
jgi:hypothetical protein